MKKLLSIIGILLLVSSNNLKAETDSKIYRITVNAEENGEIIDRMTIMHNFNEGNVVSNGIKETYVYPEIADIEYTCVDNIEEKECKELNQITTNSSIVKIELLEETNQLEFKLKYKRYVGVKEGKKLYKIYNVNKMVDLIEQETIISELEDYKLEIKIEKIN